MGVTVMVPMAEHALRAHMVTRDGVPLWTLIPSQTCDLEMRQPPPQPCRQRPAQAIQQATKSPFDLQPPVYTSPGVVTKCFICNS